MSMIFHILLHCLHNGFWLPATLGCNVKCTLLVSETVHSQLALILVSHTHILMAWPFDETLKVFASQQNIIRNNQFK